MFGSSCLQAGIGIFFGYDHMRQTVFDNVGILSDTITCADVILFYFEIKL